MGALTSLWINNWRLFSLYFFSEERIAARIRLLILIVMQLIDIGLNVTLSYWSKAVMNAFQSYEKAKFHRLLLYFCFLALVIISVSVFKAYLAKTFRLQWRRWLTDHFLKKYLSHNAFYTLSLARNHAQTTNYNTDNPDQRISIDIDSYIESVYTLLFGALSSCVSLISYVIILWSLSDVIKIKVTSNWSFPIYGYMVWAALVYAVIGTLISHWIGRALINLKYTQERCEADFRYGLMRLRDHAEPVALYRSESSEYVSLSSLFLELFANVHTIIRRCFGFNCFNDFYNTAAIVLPFIVASSRYFNKEITLGDLSQIISAFSTVYASLSFIPSAYGTIVQWRSATKRLIEFDEILKKLHADKQDSKFKFVYAPGEQSIRIQALTVKLPLRIGEDKEQILINKLNLVLESHRAVLITGNSGCGKSTFLRTLAGIWPYGCGTISFPLNDTVAFFPQKPYCPLGTLRHCLTYPSISSSKDDTDLERLLLLCQMSWWCDRLSEIQDWSRVLSLGEQQMMAFIRILHLRPKWIFLDETTSSLDEQMETRLYSILVRELANHSTIISIGHRNNLRQFHQVELTIDRGHIKVGLLSTEQ